MAPLDAAGGIRWLLRPEAGTLRIASLDYDGGPATARVAGPPARGASAHPPVQAAAAPPATAAPPPGPPVARDELLALIERFRTAYERKDLDAVMGLFGAEPRERNASGRINVQRLYARNFAALDGIRYELSDLEVVPGTDGHVVARGRYRIRAVRAGDPTQRVDTQGEIRWHVRRESGGLRISGIDYGVGP